MNNGASSKILDEVEADINAFEDMRAVRYERPLYKYLCRGHVSELKVSVVNKYGKVIDNNRQPTRNSENKISI